MGPAVAISMLFTIAAALTLGPALLTWAACSGSSTRNSAAKAHAVSADRGERGALAGADPGGQLPPSSCSGRSSCRRYRVSYDDRAYQPPTAPANQGFAAADRHFPKSKLFTEMLMVESDHDMRNSADFISLDRVAKALIRLPGVAMVQSITRPMGRPLEHATIPYLFTTQGSGNGQQLPFNEQQNANTDKQAQIQARHRRGPAERDRPDFQKLADELHKTVLTIEDLQAGHRRDELGHLQSRRLLPAAEELFLLGATLFRHSHVLGIQIAVRRARQHRQPGRQISRTPDPPLEAVDKLLPQMVAQLKLTADDTQACRL